MLINIYKDGRLIVHENIYQEVKMQIKELGEINLLEQVRTWPLVEQTADDCAVLEYTADKYLLVTTDMLVEGTHFSPEINTWQEIGRKAVEVNLSDIAAMGGTPTSLFLSLGLPSDFDLQNIKQIYAGLAKAGVPILGGDMVSADQVIINLTVLGEVKKNQVLRRSGAKIGDLVAVTGTLGQSTASGYRLIPKAKLAEGKNIALSGSATSMTDISDGLARSIYDIAAESKVGIELDLNKVPVAKGAPLEQALNGGEDYELLFTIRAGSALPVPAAIIGKVVASGQGTKLTGKGYEHFHDK
jgi:thiamine-monophosphate kinase